MSDRHRRSPTTGANANNTLISAQSFNSSVPLGHTGATPAQWRGKSIYQIITDRFGRSDSTSPACDVADRKYCGGTWQGIIGHLDYIQNMGFTAVCSTIFFQKETNSARSGYLQSLRKSVSFYDVVVMMTKLILLSDYNRRRRCLPWLLAAKYI